MTNRPKFNPGQIVLTARVNERMAGDAQFAKFVAECVMRHIRVDWGDLDPQDERVNDVALLNGDRLLSAYRYMGDVTSLVTDDIVRIWVITDGVISDLTPVGVILPSSERRGMREKTTVMFPDEY